jgi:iron-sulfur cluster assembly protein
MQRNNGAADMTISLTDNAARQIQNQLAKRGHGVGLRVGIKKVGCSGFAYTFDYADEVKADDVVSENNGAKLVVDAESAGFLNGAKLDFVREGLKQSFKFDNPNVEATCGCGESVSFKDGAPAAAKG